MYFEIKTNYRKKQTQASCKIYSFSCWENKNCAVAFFPGLHKFTIRSTVDQESLDLYKIIFDSLFMWMLSVKYRKCLCFFWCVQFVEVDFCTIFRRLFDSLDGQYRALIQCAWIFFCHVHNLLYTSKEKKIIKMCSVLTLSVAIKF